MFYTATSETSLLTQLQDLAAYNVWAISRLADWLRTKPAALLEVEAASSFPGIKATLLHIRDVERSLLAQLQEVPVPFAEQPGSEDSLEDVLEKLVEHAALFEEYLQSLTEEELQEECYCKVMFVGEICRPRFEIIQHCLNHSTYHRGQVITIGHQVGLRDAPMTDYLFYVLRVKELGLPFSTAVTGRRKENVQENTRKSFLAVNFFSK
jgi:uncharacterized damage-inducible protein DinB